MNDMCLVLGDISIELHPPRDLAGLAVVAEAELDRDARVRRRVPVGCSPLFPWVSPQCECASVCVSVCVSCSWDVGHL